MVAVIVAGNDWSSTIRFLAMCTVTPRSVAACSNSSTWRVDRAKRETSAATSTSPASAVSSSRPISRSLQDLRRWWCPPRTRSKQCLESCNSRALRASGSRRPACGWTLEDRRNGPRVQRNGRWEMLWTLSVHNNSMGSVPIRSPNRGYDSNGAKSNAKGCRLVSLAVSVRLRGGPRPSRSGASRRG